MKRAALIGLGMVAETHVAALRDSETVELVGVLGRNGEKTRAFASRASDTVGSAVKVWPDVQALAADATVDFVILATPPDARVEIVDVLAQAGKPILMEKPVERSYATARSIVDRCAANSVPLGIVFQHRARAASLALKKALSDGELGQIVSAEIRVPWWREQSYYDVPGRGTRARDGGGVMVTQAIHTLDLTLWFLGAFNRVQALMHKTILHRMDCEDWASALFETDKGCVGSLTATTAAFPGGPESIRLFGTTATAHLCEGVLTLHYRDGRKRTVGETAATGGGADPMAFTHAWHQTVIEDFAESLSSGNAPMATGREALLSHAVIEAMEASSRTGTWAKVQKR